MNTTPAAPAAPAARPVISTAHPTFDLTTGEFAPAAIQLGGSPAGPPAIVEVVALFTTVPRTMFGTATVVATCRFEGGHVGNFRYLDLRAVRFR